MAQGKKINFQGLKDLGIVLHVYISKRLRLTLLLTALCLLFFIPFLANPQLLAEKDNDLGRTYIPMFTYLRNSFVTNKSIPLWRGDQMMGESLIANPISSLFYPANVIFLIFPPGLGATIYYLVHFIVAATATFYLGRSFKFTKTQSFAAANFYAFSTKMLLHLSAGHITMIAAFSYFPLTFLAVRKLLKAPSISWIIIAGGSLAFMLIAYPTIFYYASLFIITYLLYYCLYNTPILKGRKFLIISSSLIAVFVLAFLFTAIEFLPQLAFGPISSRSELSYGDVAIPLFNAKRYLISLLLPYLDFKNLDHESFLYLGAVPTVLAFFGFWKLSFYKKVAVAVSAVMTVLFTLGDSTPLFNLAYHFLPLLKYTRVTTRIWFAVALIVALLAAYGLKSIKNQKLAILVICFFLIENFSIGYRKILSFPNLNNKKMEIYRYLADDRSLYRVYCTTYCFNPQLLKLYGIQILNGENPIQQQSFVNFLSKAGGYSWDKFAVIFPPFQVWQQNNPPFPDALLLGDANVKYIASTYILNDPNFIYRNKFDDIYIYENTFFKPRAYFENSETEARITKYEPNRIIITFEPAQTTRRLVFSENYFPGWLIIQGPFRGKVEPYNNVFRSAVIMPGISSAEFIYRPQNFTIGKILLAGTVLSLFSYFLYISFKYRRDQ